MSFFSRPTYPDMYSTGGEPISPERRLDFVVNSSDSNDSHNYSNFVPTSLDSFSAGGGGMASAGGGGPENFNTIQMVRPIPLQNGQKMRTVADLHNFPSSDEDIHHALPVYLPSSDGASSGADDHQGAAAAAAAVTEDAKDPPVSATGRQQQKSPYFPPIVNQFPSRSIKPMREFHVY